MRVLHLIINLNVGGAERALQKLVLDLRKKQCESLVVLLKGGGVIADELKQEGLQVVVLKNPFQIRQIVSEFKPDLIQAWMWHAILLSLLTPRAIPRIWAIRQSNHDLRGRPLAWLVLKCIALGSRRIAAVVYNSNSGMLWHRQFGFGGKSISVIPNGFDVEKFKPHSETRSVVRQSLGITDQDLVIGFVGRNHPDKGIRFLVEAFYKLSEKIPRAHLILVGAGLGQENQEILSDPPVHALGKRIHRMGAQSDVRQFLNAMDIFCLPSVRHEGFPNVIGEAMSMEVPCVATDVGDAKEIVESAGIIVSPGNASDLSRALVQIASMSESDRRALGVKARERIARVYPLESSSEQYWKLYQQVV